MLIIAIVWELNGDETIYLTTQELQYTLEDEPLLLSPPVQGLSEDFSMAPTLMGNLLLQNVNLWMGNSTQPSTSGLHHDYHDNLYILLRGKKTFYLYSYDDIDCLYPTGEVCLLKFYSRKMNMIICAFL